MTCLNSQSFEATGSNSLHDRYKKVTPCLATESIEMHGYLLRTTHSTNETPLENYLQLLWFAEAFSSWLYRGKYHSVTHIFKYEILVHRLREITG